jgi:ribonuclease BN (tRNA processing enzyme)
MNLTFLGTCSGTEPMPDRRHTSFAIEHDGHVYWFDAGEGCSHTAHVLGVDLLATRAVFISHTHMDHLGGLANLLWNVRKLNGIDPQRRFRGQHISVLIPDLSVWQAIVQLLRGTEGGFAIDFGLEGNSYDDGSIYDHDGFRVTAQHNLHLGEPADGQSWRSYSFAVEAGGKRLIYSGDVKSIRDLDPILYDCDLLLMETGHHRVHDVCTYLAAAGPRIGQLGFLHHGRAVLEDPLRELETARSILGDRVFVADDGMAVAI